MSEIIPLGTLEARLQRSNWELRRQDGKTPPLRLRLGERGNIHDPRRHNEILWRIHDDGLELIDAWGRITSRFGAPVIGEEGSLTLRGLSIDDAGNRFDSLLTEAQDKLSARSVEITGRRNLVVMRAGNGALYPEWAPSPYRSWDLAISFYGEGEPDWGQEYFQPAKGPKWEPIHAWLVANPEILRGCLETRSRALKFGN